MFENDFFEKWLDKKALEIMEKIGEGHEVKSEEMIILVLKAQSNHFHHLDQEMRGEIALLREDMDRRFEQVDQRFEQVDQRFEQIERRFEQVDQRFEQIVKRLDRFMFWSLGLVFGAVFFIIKFG